VGGKRHLLARYAPIATRKVGTSDVRIDRGTKEKDRRISGSWGPRGSHQQANRKKHGKKLRPLGLPSWSDKLLQEVMRSILETYYEPQLSDLAHGFRPGRGCHTALSTVKETWTGTKWYIEGDIAGCFDGAC
jgi:retron-type reverse transcriptase